MSTAHRPTWTPAQGKDIKSGSRQFSARDIASQTKLKFRQSGQDSTGEVSKRDLRAELLAAEQEARDKKRKAEGKPVIESSASTSAIENGEDEATKRRKLLQQALELDKDDDDDDDEDSDEDMADGGEKKNGNKPSDEDEDDDDDDESDDEDDTAELLRELEKIKRERAEEKERLEREKAENSAVAREEEIATSNPLMNLAAALGQQKGSVSSAGFSVKKRWDDDLVFKNQAVNDDKPSGEFVNDLLRTEFHKKFMSKFIK